jgi:hypothetical protein
VLVVLIKAPHHEHMMLNVAGFERGGLLLRGSIRLLKFTFLTDPDIPIQQMHKQISFP